MLVLEGTDCSGKSTLLGRLLPLMTKKLSQVSGDGYGRVTTQHFGVLPESFDYYKDYLKNISVDGVSDRFQFSELVYGPVLRGAVNPKFDQSRQDMVLLELLVTGSFVVRCSCRLQEIAERFKKRGDENVKKLETFERLIDGFSSLRYVVPKIDVDTARPVSDEVVQQVVDFWFAQRTRALDYARVGGGWGTLEPGKLLVVGERPNNDAGIKAPDGTYTLGGPYWPRPFSVPNPVGKTADQRYLSSSTDWVLTMLRRAGLQPCDFHVTNVYHTPSTNESHLADEIEFLRPEKIVVMGSTARDVVVSELRAQDRVPVFDMPHPQYLRRFYQGEFNRFCAHLENFVKTDFRCGGCLKEWRP